MENVRQKRGHADRRSSRTGVPDELARELHDVVAQPLTALVVLLESQRSPDRPDVDMMLDQARRALRGLRGILYGLRHGPRGERRIQRELEQLFNGFSESTSIPVVMTASEAWPKTLSANVAHHVLRIAAEALVNSHRHANPNLVTASLDVVDGRPVLTLRDDGTPPPGFDPGMYAGEGIQGMKERAAIIGADLTISRREPRGTEVKLVLPGLEPAEGVEPAPGTAG